MGSRAIAVPKRSGSEFSPGHENFTCTLIHGEKHSTARPEIGSKCLVFAVKMASRCSSAVAAMSASASSSPSDSACFSINKLARVEMLASIGRILAFLAEKSLFSKACSLLFRQPWNSSIKVIIESFNSGSRSMLRAASGCPRKYQMRTSVSTSIMSWLTGR